MNAGVIETGSSAATWMAASAAWMRLASATMATMGITGGQMAAVVGAREITLGECAGLVLPMTGHPGDRRRRQRTVVHTGIEPQIIGEVVFDHANDPLVALVAEKSPATR
jgi:hypothetical protein